MLPCLSHSKTQIRFRARADERVTNGLSTTHHHVITAETPELAKVEERVDTEESISLAFLVLLEQLQPIERTVFLRHALKDITLHRAQPPQPPPHVRQCRPL